MIRRRDEGSTLVEVLTSSGILAVILPVLLGAVVLVWNTFAAATSSVDASAKLSVLSSSFRADVAQSLSAVEGGPACSGPGSALATLTLPGGAVSYVVDASGALVRRDCTVSPAASVSLSLPGVSPSLSCPSSVPADPCRTLELVLPSSGGDHVISASRRVS